MSRVLSTQTSGERRVADFAAAWANDALARIDLDGFYDDEQVLRLDQDLARQAVRDAWATTTDPGIIWTVEPTVTFPDPLTIEVTVVGEVPLLFLDAVPGVHHRVISTTSTATLVVTG